MLPQQDFSIKLLQKSDRAWITPQPCFCFVCRWGAGIQLSLETPSTSSCCCCPQASECLCTTLRGILTLLCLHASHWKFSVMFVDSSVLFFFFIIIIVFILIFTTEHKSEPNRLVIFSGLACRCILKSGKILFCGPAVFGIICKKYGLTYGEVLENNVRYTMEINIVSYPLLCAKRYWHSNIPCCT